MAASFQLLTPEPMKRDAAYAYDPMLPALDAIRRVRPQPPGDVGFMEPKGLAGEHPCLNTGHNPPYEDCNTRAAG